MNRIKREVAIHEAGHAVGRFLTAERLGYAIDEAISHIEVNAVPVVAGKVSFDGRARLTDQATTFGPMFSRQLLDFITASRPPNTEFNLTWPEQINIVAKAKAAGVDVDAWFRAKAISTIFGPMAEARFLGQPFEFVWNGYNAEGDITATVREGLMCGMTPEQIESALDEIIIEAQQEIDRPEVWQAIEALADNLKLGRMSGKKATRIIKHALKAASTR